jgi:hypothetical protein
MRIDEFLVAIGLFSLVVTIMLATAVDISQNYADEGINIAIDENASAAFSQASEINSLAQEMQSKLTSTPPGAANAFNAFIYGAWSALVLSFKSLTMIVTLITNVGALFGLPPMITLFITSSIIITLVVILAYLVFRLGSTGGS